jgi:hypothetical protein
MGLDLPRFYKACNPSKPLTVGEQEDRQYYIDFSSVRGSKIIESLKRTITLISPVTSAATHREGRRGTHPRHTSTLP